MFLTLRRTTIVFMYFYETMYLKKEYSNKISQSVYLIGAGALIAQASDLTSDYLGVLLVCANNIISSIQFNMNKSVCERNPRLNAIGQTFYNATICVPLAFICGLVIGDVKMALDFEFSLGLICFVILAA